MNIALDETLMDGVHERLDRIEQRLADIESVEQLGVEIETIQEETMSDLSLRIDNLSAEVSENRSAVDSARTLLTSVHTDLQTVRDELARRGVADEDLAALDALTTSLSDNTDDLAEAVAENTEAEADGTDTGTGTTTTTPSEPTPDDGVDSAPMGGTTFDNTAPDV